MKYIQRIVITVLIFIGAGFLFAANSRFQLLIFSPKPRQDPPTKDKESNAAVEDNDKSENFGPSNPAAGPRHIDMFLDLNQQPRRKRYKPDNKDYIDLYRDYDDTDLPDWQIMHKRINRHELYGNDDPTIDRLINQLATDEIVGARQKSGGTQIKIIFSFPDEAQALMKPMRFPRNQQTLPNHFYFTDYERHTAEIAAFHLDRLFDWRRTPPVVGRVIDIPHNIQRLIDDKEFLRTVFVSPAGNLCFHGKCTYYCDTSHAICGSPDHVEGSLALFLPLHNVAPRSAVKHPWRRSYHKRKRADWETNDNYCDKVRVTPPNNRGRRLLDIMDMAVFDFLTGNMDRHNFDIFKQFGNFSSPVLLDQGRGFGQAFHDEISILAPIYQCCLIRHSTLTKLLNFHRGPVTLSIAMRRSLAKDPLKAVLWEPHLTALDRRVELILRYIRKCLRQTDGLGFKQIVVDDGF